MAGPITSSIVDSQFIYTGEPGSKYDTVVYVRDDNNNVQTAGSDEELQGLLDSGYTAISKNEYNNRRTGLDNQGNKISTVDEYLANNPQLKGRSGARELVEVFINEWIKTGSEDMAEDAMYNSIYLEQAFPGIKDDNGVPIYTISQYTATERNYNVALSEKGLNPFLPFLQEKKADLFRNQIDPTEFSSRLEEIRSNVIDNPNKDTVLEKYNQYFIETGRPGVEMTDEALFLLAIAPDADSLLLDERFKIADIGVQAALKGFNISKGMALDLFERGYGVAEATQTFGSAANILKRTALQQARASGMPVSESDMLSIEDYMSAFVDLDADALTTFTRITSAAASAESADVSARTTETGQVVGLTEL